jgi:hypothetical protein
VHGKGVIGDSHIDSHSAVQAISRFVQHGESIRNNTRSMYVVKEWVSR